MVNDETLTNLDVPLTHQEKRVVYTKVIPLYHFSQEKSLFPPFKYLDQGTEFEVVKVGNNVHIREEPFVYSASLSFKVCYVIADGELWFMNTYHVENYSGVVD